MSIVNSLRAQYQQQDGAESASNSGRLPARQRSSRRFLRHAPSAPALSRSSSSSVQSARLSLKRSSSRAECSVQVHFASGTRCTFTASLHSTVDQVKHQAWQSAQSGAVGRDMRDFVLCLMDDTPLNVEFLKLKKACVEAKQLASSGGLLQLKLRAKQHPRRLRVRSRSRPSLLAGRMRLDLPQQGEQSAPQTPKTARFSVRAKERLRGMLSPKARPARSVFFTEDSDSESPRFSNSPRSRKQSPRSPRTLRARRSVNSSVALHTGALDTKTMEVATGVVFPSNKRRSGLHSTWAPRSSRERASVELFEQQAGGNDDDYVDESIASALESSDEEEQNVQSGTITLAHDLEQLMQNSAEENSSSRCSPLPNDNNNNNNNNNDAYPNDNYNRNYNDNGGDGNGCSDGEELDERSDSFGRMDRVEDEGNPDSLVVMDLHDSEHNVPARSSSTRHGSVDNEEEGNRDSHAESAPSIAVSERNSSSAQQTQQPEEQFHDGKSSPATEEQQQEPVQRVARKKSSVAHAFSSYFTFDDSDDDDVSSFQDTNESEVSYKMVGSRSVSSTDVGGEDGNVVPGALSVGFALSSDSEAEQRAPPDESRARRSLFGVDDPETPAAMCKPDQGGGSDVVQEADVIVRNKSSPIVSVFELSPEKDGSVTVCTPVHLRAEDESWSPARPRETAHPRMRRRNSIIVSAGSSDVFPGIRRAELKELSIGGNRGRTASQPPRPIPMALSSDEGSLTASPRTRRKSKLADKLVSRINQSVDGFKAFVAPNSPPPGLSRTESASSSVSPSPMLSRRKSRGKDAAPQSPRSPGSPASPTNRLRLTRHSRSWSWGNAGELFSDSSDAESRVQRMAADMVTLMQEEEKETQRASAQRQRTLLSLIEGKRRLIPIFQSAASAHEISLVCTAPGYWIESVYEFEEWQHPANFALHNADWDRSHYQQNLVALPHVHYCGTDEAIGPFVVSIATESQEDDRYPAIFWDSEGVHPFSIHKLDAGRLAQKKMRHQVLRRVLSLKFSLRADSALHSVKNEQFERELVSLEQSFVPKGYKFGVLYRCGNQTENEMFNNRGESSTFREFLRLLGERVDLLGWQDFRGGLDVKHGHTGQQSVFTTWPMQTADGTVDAKIMFHVSTLLPFTEGDEQQLERKRHIGNDIVVVIFQDGPSAPFDPSLINSEFNHAFMVVHPILRADGTTMKYSFSCCYKEGVPQEIPPFLPHPAVFSAGKQFRQLLLSKLVNAERACYEAPSFKEKIKRTRNMRLKMMASDAGSKKTKQRSGK